MTSQRVERRLAAVLAADVAGYSRLMGIDEEGTLARLKAVRKALVDPAIASHRGRIVKTTGDGLLVEFASAVDAVRGAVEVQHRMAELNTSVPQDQRIEFRIGIHVGDIIIDDNDIFGDGVNVAARLEGIAEPGGVCMSDDAYRQVRGKVEMACEDIGPQALKNIAEPLRTWRMQLSGQKAGKAEPVSLAKQAPPLTLPDKPSIAVLPFQNMSGDPEQEYFADGMVEDIITALSRFKSLLVIARNSSFTFKGKAVDIKQVGRELGVRYVLEGSVRRAREKVRITTQLIDANSGSHVWADRFDGSLLDVFDMQDSVTASVVGAIAPRLNEAELETVSRKPSENWDSYDFYLRGLKLAHQGNQGGVNAEATVEALSMFRRSVDLDPANGRARAGVASCIRHIKYIHNQPISEQERAEALSSAELAIKLSEDDEVVLSGVAGVFAHLVGDIARAMELADRALAINPNWSHAWNARGLMSVMIGQHERALEAFGKALRLNPLDKTAVPMTMFGSASASFMLGRYEESIVWARKLLALQPNNIGGLLNLTGSNYFSGQLAEAEAAAAQIKRYHPHLRAPHLRQSFLLQRPADIAARERTIAFIGLPE